jgi:hypothetical protein
LNRRSFHSATPDFLLLGHPIDLFTVGFDKYNITGELEGSAGSARFPR